MQFPSQSILPRKPERFSSLPPWLIAIMALAAAPDGARADHNSLHATACNETDTVGAGALGVSPGPVGPGDSLGWDVGSGQCNGSFTVTSDPAFPSSGGDGIELGMRVEHRSVGQVMNSGGTYVVETGPDTTQPNPSRAWWNFQQSVAYDGDIGSLDELVFSIRTDAGSSIPAPPADMLAIRSGIDSRNSQPNPTATYSDLFQTSQNPTFGWLTDGAGGGYDFNGEGAWTLTLAAYEAGALADVSICVHTVGESCAPPPTVYSCSGDEAGLFAPPAHKVVRTRTQNRTLPLKMSCSDGAGNSLGAGNLAPPVLVVTKQPSGPATANDEPFLSSGLGGPGNAFAFRGGRWHFNLSLKNFSGPGMYEISAASGGTDLLLGAPVATLIIE